MRFIKGVLTEEYNRLLHRKTGSEAKLLCQDITPDRRETLEPSLTNITEDILFIEKTFHGNNSDIQFNSKIKFKCWYFGHFHIDCVFRHIRTGNPEASGHHSGNIRTLVS